MVEIAVVMVVIALVLGIGIKGFGGYMDDLALKGATDHIANTLQLTRDRAVATRTSQTMRFEAGYSGTDYRVEVGGVMATGWKLPKRISYNWASGTITAVTMTPEGRASTSGLVILQNTRGQLDTVSVLSSGLVLTK